MPERIRKASINTTIVELMPKAMNMPDVTLPPLLSTPYHETDKPSTFESSIYNAHVTRL